MSSLKRQLRHLEPLLNKSTSVEDIHISLVTKERESYYERQGNVLHALGMNKEQNKFFTFYNNFQGDSPQLFIDKLGRLIGDEGVGVQPVFTEGENGWQVQIDGKVHPIGKITSIFSFSITENTVMIPDFIRNIAKALQPILTRGNFYYGYWKDKDTAIMNDFAFILLYVPHSHSNVLRKFSDLEWHCLVDIEKEHRVGSVAMKTEDDTIVLKWRKSTTWVTGIVLLVGFYAITATANAFFNFHEIQIPSAYIIGSLIFVLVVGILDYINRAVVLACTPEKITVNTGVLLFFPGYSRKVYQLKDIVRVWINSKASSSGVDDGPTSTSIEYAVFVTTRQPKEVRLTNYMEHNEAVLLKNSIEKFLKKD